MFVRQFAGQTQDQAVGKADDGGQRRAQLVRDIGQKSGFQPIGVFQRLGAFAQGMFDAGGIGDVAIGDQRIAIGQGRLGEIEDAAIAARDARPRRVSGVIERGYGAFQPLPHIVIGQMGAA